MLWKQRNLLTAAVIGLGAAMVAATLIVGLGRDGGGRPTAAIVGLGRASVTGAAPSPTPPNVSAAPKVNVAPPPKVDAQKEAAAQISVSTSGSMPKDKKTFKVVSARGDLSGQRELTWRADNGHAVGDARCTQNVRLNPQSKPSVKPTLLICWRLSATKSVYTVLVDLNHKPSERASVAAIDRAWRALR
jgi:hypothetical protein